jgi:hypothetical protein
MMSAADFSRAKNLTPPIFSVLFATMYASRVLVVSQVIESSALTISVQLLYLAFVVLVWLTELKYGRYQPTAFSLFVALIALHIFLFCFVFINPAMPSELNLAQTNGLFLLIVVFTAWFVRSRDMSLQLASICFYVLGVVLFLEMMLHPADVNLTGIGMLFSTTGRTRSVFGFGHANTLGGMCVALFMMYIYRLSAKSESRGISKCLDYSLLAVGAVMLLCSASRSSLIGLILLLSSWAIGCISLKNGRRKATGHIAILFAAVVFLYTALTLAESADLQVVLDQSNRNWLFRYAIPSLLNSGRTLIGLGYVSNTAYGEGLTPYRTLWLDSGYVYYLVATGVIGLAIILAALFVLFKSTLKYTDGRKHIYVVAVLATYLFMGLFEDMILNGAPLNYFLVPVLLSLIPKMPDHKQANRSLLGEDANV